MPKIKNAVIICGPGRSGTTLLSSILSLHKDFYWISGYVNRFPESPFLSVLNNLQRLDWFEKFNRGRKYFPRPAEAYGFWYHYFDEFDTPGAKPSQLETFNAIRAIEGIDNYSSANRFITKLTGKSRIHFIEAMFEDPIILWIDRQPEAVVMSYYKQRWRYKNKPGQFAAKPTNELITEYCDLFLAVQEDREKLKKFEFHQVFYEDMVSDPVGFFKALTNDLGLKQRPSFYRKVQGWGIFKGSNESYKKLISPEEDAFLQQQLAGVSETIGYTKKLNN